MKEKRNIFEGKSSQTSKKKSSDTYDEYQFEVLQIERKKSITQYMANKSSIVNIRS